MRRKALTPGEGGWQTVSASAVAHSGQSPTPAALDVDAIRRANQDGYWKVPAASYSTSNPKRATTLYASDRDVFLERAEAEALLQTLKGEDPQGTKVL